MKNYNFYAFQTRYSAAIEANLHSHKRNSIIRRTCELLNRFDNYLQEAAISYWSDTFKIPKIVLKSYIAGTEVQEQNASDNYRLRNFLALFSIQQNEISGDVIIQKDGVHYTIDELILECEDNAISPRNLRRFINPDNQNITVTNLHNPFKDLFQRYADNYRGEALISELSSCITAYDFGDKEQSGFYKKQMEYFFHKWMCKAAGQALGLGSNDVMLLWVEPLGGSGKSYINRWLFSLPEMIQYYLRMSENESFIDMKGISKKMFAIDFDELPLSKKRYLMFKSHIAAEVGQVYNKSTKRYESYKRHVNFIGSTNKANRAGQRGYLLDDDNAMMRRIVPIEIEGQINYKKYMNDIDREQLWGQAAATILLAKQQGDEKLLKWDCDHAKLREMNKRYVDTSTGGVESAIRNMFKRSHPANGGILMQTSEIIQYMQSKDIKITNSKAEQTKIGIFLAQQKYEQGRKSNGSYAWWVSV